MNQVRIHPDPILSEVCSETGLTPESLKIGEELAEFIRANPYAAGIAAPQLGYSKRIFAIRSKKYPLVFFDPVVEAFGAQHTNDEGCLSLPGKVIPVARHGMAKVKFFNQDKQPRSLVFEGFAARVIQHENDHLDGKLILRFS